MTHPFFERAPSILNRPDGSVLFECIVQGSPQPDVHWFFKDKELQAGDKYVMKVKKTVGKFTCTLQMKNPDRHDQGIYKVVAKNQHGSAEKEQTYVAQCVGDSMYKEGNF